MDDKEIAALLLSSFFPVPSKPVDPDSSSTNSKLITRFGSRPGEHAGKKVPLRTKLPKWTLAEVGAAIMQSNSDKAPGLDEITFRVWKELWPILGSVVLKLYQASLDLKYVPQRWRKAKIVVLHEPNKLDYSLPKAYRPISLLEMIGMNSHQLHRSIVTRPGTASYPFITIWPHLFLTRLCQEVPAAATTQCYMITPAAHDRKCAAYVDAL